MLTDYRNMIWKEVSSHLQDSVYPVQFQIEEKYKSEAAKHWKMVRDYPERMGKYIRPILLMLTAEAMGLEKDKVKGIAAAMELSEEWILVHDDFEDDSMLRRGKPTLHRIYGPQLAINAGDALHVAMWGCLYEGTRNFEEEIADKIYREFVTMLTRTALGQTVEITWTQENKFGFNDKDWLFIADSKTSYYTIAGPMRLGAMAAGATEKQLDIITELGINLGRCFQLRDDVLDVCGDFEGLKETGNDIYEGKRTVILGHLLRSIKASDRVRLENILSKNRDGKKPGEVAWVIKKMNECGCIEYANKMSEAFGKKSVEIYETEMDFIKEEPYRSYLAQVIKFILERDH